MKKITMSGAAAFEYKPAQPERTARRQHTGLDFDVTFQIWPSRESMARSIRMQERGCTPNPWKACVALTDGEGY